MPVSRLSTRRRKSSYGLNGVYTPAKPGIYAAPSLPMYHPSLVEKVAGARSISFAPNVTPVSYSASEEAQAQAKADQDAASLLARARAMPDGTGDILASDPHNLASGVYASQTLLLTSADDESPLAGGSGKEGGDDAGALVPASILSAVPTTVGQKRRKRIPPGKRPSQGYIPRPPNAFMLFRADFVKQKHVPGSIEQNHGSLSKIIATIWNELPAKEQEQWKARARAEKAAHKALYPQYKFKPVHKKKPLKDAPKKQIKNDDDEDQYGEGDDGASSSRGQSMGPRSITHQPERQKSQRRLQAEDALLRVDARHQRARACREEHLTLRQKQMDNDRNAMISRLISQHVEGAPLNEAIAKWTRDRDAWENHLDVQELEQWRVREDGFAKEKAHLQAIIDEEKEWEREPTKPPSERARLEEAGIVDEHGLTVSRHGFGQNDIMADYRVTAAPQPQYSFAPFQPLPSMQERHGAFMRRPSSVPALPSDFNFFDHGAAPTNYNNQAGNMLALAPFMGPPDNSPANADVGISSMSRQQQTGWFAAQQQQQPVASDDADAEEELDRVEETFTNPFASSTSSSHSSTSNNNASSDPKAADPVSRSANNLAAFNARMSFSMPPGSGFLAVPGPRVSFSNNRMSFSNNRMSFSNNRMSFSNGNRMSFSNGPGRMSFSNSRMSFSMANGPRMSFSSFGAAAPGQPFAFSNPFAPANSHSAAQHHPSPAEGEQQQAPLHQQTEYGFGMGEFAAAQGFEVIGSAGPYTGDAYGYAPTSAAASPYAADGMIMMDMSGNAIHPTLAQRLSLGARRASSAQAMLESWTSYGDYEHSPSAASAASPAVGSGAGAEKSQGDLRTVAEDIENATAEKLPEVRAELFNDSFSFGGSSAPVPDAETLKSAHHSRTSSLAHNDAHVSPIEQPIPLVAAPSPFISLADNIALELEQQQWDVNAQPIAYPC